jgi:hypothetical protein
MVALAKLDHLTGKPFACESVRALAASFDISASECALNTVLILRRPAPSPCREAGPAAQAVTMAEGSFSTL